MSNIKSNLFDSEYDTYNEAVRKYLDEKRLSNKWLVQEIKEKDQKEASLHSQISRWLSEKKIKNNNQQPVGNEYQEKINNALDIVVKQKSNGKWTISRTKESVEEKLETEEGRAIFEKIKKYLALNNSKESDNQTQKILLAFRDQLKSQRSETDSMIQLLNVLLHDD